jgi:outer membrane protein
MDMRKLFGSLITIAGFIAVAGPLAAQVNPAPVSGFRLGYLDSSKLLAETPGASEIQATLTKEMAGFQAQADAMQDSAAAMNADFQQKSLVMSVDAKAKRQGEINQKLQSFQLRSQQLNEQARLRQQQLMEPLMAKVEAAIGEVRKAEGMAIIFDKAAPGFIVSADTTLDITNKVIAKLKTGIPAPAK